MMRGLTKVNKIFNDFEDISEFAPELAKSNIEGLTIAPSELADSIGNDELAKFVEIVN